MLEFKLIHFSKRAPAFEAYEDNQVLVSYIWNNLINISE